MKKSNPYIKLLSKSSYSRVWKESDDILRSPRLLSEIYSDVPKELDVLVDVLEIHTFPKGKKTAIKNWLNRSKS